MHSVWCMCVAWWGVGTCGLCGVGCGVSFPGPQRKPCAWSWTGGDLPLAHCYPHICSPDHAALHLHLKHFPVDLRTLTCQMAYLHSNGRGRGGSLWSPVSVPPVGSHLSTPFGPSGTECCPVNWVEHEGNCYWFSRSGMTWPEARKYCQLENAHLVVINSWEEQVRPCFAKPEEISNAGFVRRPGQACFSLLT